MMQLRIFLHIFLLLFFVGIVFGKGEYGHVLLKKILKRETTDMNERNSSKYLEIFEFYFYECITFIKTINAFCNCKELKTSMASMGFSLKDWTICEVAKYFNDILSKFF